MKAMPRLLQIEKCEHYQYEYKSGGNAWQMLEGGQVENIGECPIEEPPTQQRTGIRKLTTSQFEGVTHAPNSHTSKYIFLIRI